MEVDGYMPSRLRLGMAIGERAPVTNIAGASSFAT